MRRELPSGTVTFLFTDVEGSTRLLHELGAQGYAEALAEHRRVIRAACAAEGGREVDTQGDAFFFAFPTAPGALSAAEAFTTSLARGPIRVRVGLHTGTAHLAEEGYVGGDVHRTARIAVSGHGGQILVSQSTASLVDVELRDLGEHRFKDLGAAERVYQLGRRDFPALKSLYRTNLPVPATPFLGRERELAQVVELVLREDVRLLTLTGPGGTGKTRLAVQAAAEAAEAFPDGICWVPLASLRDPSSLLPAVAQALDAREQPGVDLVETLSNALSGKRALLLLDNVEHLLPAAAREIAAMGSMTGPMLLVTSRERLQIQGEQMYSVPTLDESDGVSLFVARARALDRSFPANGYVRELCSRLDQLPLALELAAARTVVFSTEQLLARLAERLDLLTAGRNADPRQQTLRGTIEWSYDLLDDGEQRLFRRLSVFAGGCTYEAAEELCGAGPDTLQSLIDKSLVRRRDTEFGPRYWMLETIREYASERLEEGGDAASLYARHAEWCCKLTDRIGVGPWLTDEEFRGFAYDYDNVRVALAWAWRNGDDERALRIGACHRFWARQGLFNDAVAWLEAATPKIASAESPIQLLALKVAGAIAFFVLADTEQAHRYWARALTTAEELGADDDSAWIRDRLAGVARERGDPDLALAQYRRSLDHYRASANRLGEADSLHFLGEMLRDVARFDEAETALVDADAIYEEFGMELAAANNAHSRADLELDRGDLIEATRLYRDCLVVFARLGDQRHIAYCLAGMAGVLSDRGSEEAAATAWGAVCGFEETFGFRMIASERRRYQSRLSRFEDTPAWRAGKKLALGEAVELVRKELEAL